MLASEVRLRWLHGKVVRKNWMQNSLRIGTEKQKLIDIHI